MNFSGSEPFKATKIWNDLVENLKTNLDPKKRRWKLQTFENCFKGSEVVEELQNYVLKHPELVSDPSKVQVKSLGQVLVESRIIESVASTSEGRKDSFEHGNHLYRFVENQEPNIEPYRNGDKAGRKKKRLSLDIWSVNKRSSKRRSMATTYSGTEGLVSTTRESADENHNEFSCKRRKSFGGSSGFKGENHMNNTSSKIRRRSFTKKSKAAFQEEVCVYPNIYKDIRFQVTLSSLLKLVDISHLEDILVSSEPSTCSSTATELANNPYDRLVKSLDDSFSKMDSLCELRGGRRGRDSIWKQAAVECFNALKEYPLEQEEGFEFHNKVVITEAGISSSLAKFYGSLTDSLIPSNLTVLLEGIMQLLKTRQRTIHVICALRMLIMLMPDDREEHLKRLLNFFQMSLISQARISAEQRKKYLCRIFANGILSSSIQDHEMTEALILFMISEHKKLFHVVPSIKEEAKRHLECIQKGIDVPTLSVSAFNRLTVAKYEHQKEGTTRQSLNELMNCVLEDLTISIKTREQLLKDFHKHHPEVFEIQFPGGELE